VRQAPSIDGSLELFLKYMMTFNKGAIEVIRAAVRISAGLSDFALK